MAEIILLGKGYIGSGLDRYLNSIQVPVTSLSKKEFDYTSFTELNDLVKRKKPSVIINCSGFTGFPNVDGCETNKELCWFWNVLVPHTIAQVADLNNVPLVHVSSGCIYTGHEKEYTEQDIPNFGFYNRQSSFYSQCKHISEMILSQYKANTLRIRMPFDSTDKPKNYLNKIFKYNNLISQKNSLTSVTDLYRFVYRLLPLIKTINPGPINVVNPGGLEAKEIVSLLRKYSIENKNWNFIDVKDLNVVANRSNCVLSSEYTRKLGIELPSSIESLERDIQQFAKLLQS